MQTYIINIPQTGEEYFFDAEEPARFFQACRTVRPMTLGSTPRDNGNLFLTPDERKDVLSREPKLAKFIHRVYGSREFIQNIERYCFWLTDATPTDIKRSKILYERVKNIKEFRLASTREETRKQADNPHLFTEIRQPKTEYLLIPSVSSKERTYIPIGYLPPEVITTDAAFVLENATPYHFAILTSIMHMAWMRRVCGRLRDDYRYSNTIVYNDFVFPKADPRQVLEIFRTGCAILDARENHPSASLADLYDEVSMPKDLRDAHRANDKAVLAAYGLPADTPEDEMVEFMFKLYHEALGR